MQKHPLNIKLSQEVYRKCRKNIQAKGCYENIFHVVTEYKGKFETGEWKVAYGYILVLANENLMTRHCYIVNSQGEAIDPSLVSLTHFDETKDFNHVSFYRFDSIDEYLDMVVNNLYVPDLIKPLRKKEKEIGLPWAEQQGYILIG